MLKIIRILSFITLFTLLTGCAVGTSELQLVEPELSLKDVSATKSVFVNLPTDNRVFNPQTKDPSVPSTEPSNKAVGRKRNTWGAALGDFALAGDQTVNSLVKVALEKAFESNGFKVINNKADIAKSTLVVDSQITKFWTWSNPGFSHITLSANIETDVEIKDSRKSEEKIKIEGRYSEGFQLGLTSNFQKVLQKAYDYFISNATLNLDKPLKKLD